MPIWLACVVSGAISQARAAGTPDTKACDRAAASPYDGERPTGLTGIPIEHIDAKSARPACEKALASAPGDKRLLFEYARVLEADKDQKAAADFYARSADLGYAAAQYSLGIFYMEGYGGLAPNDLRAAQLYSQGARQGNAQAQVWLATFYQDGRGGFAKDLNEAARWYERAAAQGVLGAQARLNDLRNTNAAEPTRPADARAESNLGSANEAVKAAGERSALGKPPTDTIKGVKVVTYPVFQQQLREALLGQKLDLNVYRKDIELISALALRCPSQMPRPDFHGKDWLADQMGIVQHADPYYDTPAGKTCEQFPLQAGGETVMPRPVVSGSEPRKLYLLGKAVPGSAIAPGSRRAAYQITVSIEPVDQSIPVEQRCSHRINPMPCMQQILSSIVFPDDEFSMIKQRADEARHKEEAAMAAVAARVQKEKDEQAAREREQAAWDALPEDEKQRRIAAQKQRAQELAEAQQKCTARCAPAEAACHEHNQNRGFGIMAGNGMNMSSLMMSGIAADDCDSVMRVCVSRCTGQ